MLEHWQRAAMVDLDGLISEGEVSGVLDNSVISNEKTGLPLAGFAGVFNKASPNPFRKECFLLLKIVLAKWKSPGPSHCGRFFEGWFPTVIV